MRFALAVGILVVSSTAAAAKTPLPARADHSVYDSANVIDDAHERQLEAINAELFQRAKVAVVVITVPRLIDETIAELAVRVQHDWGVGQRGQDESVVIALSLEDRKIFLATGYGSEGYLPDGKVGEIRDRATPLLRNNDFGGGLTTADLAIAQVAAAAHGITLTGVPAVGAPASDDDGAAGIIGIAVVLGILVLGGILGGRGRGGTGGSGFGGFWLGALLGGMAGNRGSDRSGDGGFGGGGGGFGGFGGGSGGGGGAGGSF